ncbi:MAG: hypothetical protein ACKVKH_16910, partial [Verrucomicrobiales bacterium]
LARSHFLQDSRGRIGERSSFGVLRYAELWFVRAIGGSNTWISLRHPGVRSKAVPSPAVQKPSSGARFRLGLTVV